MAYESRYERFRVIAADGSVREVQFKKAGFLAVGDQPEVYFFEFDGKQVVVAVSGEALRAVQRGFRSLSREEKIDAAGLQLKQEMEAGGELSSERLYIESKHLEGLLRDLGILG